MAENTDFERAWLSGFACAIEEIAGAKIRDVVMMGSEELASRPDRDSVLGWTGRALERLEALVEEDLCRQVLTRCACQYPAAALQLLRETYEREGDVGAAQQVLQDQFESLLRDSLALDERLIGEVVGRGWGSAGIRRGSTIIATKIPKSSNLVNYLKEHDPVKKRQLYCHCPRVRDAVEISGRIPPIYCYCGAGFYKHIWEEILQRAVEVEVLETVLQGDEVCKFAIYLSADD